MVAELQARGWSRFTATQLEKYLDWALQDVYGKAKFDRSTLSTAVVAGTVLDVIPFTTISGGGAELVNEVKAVYVKQTGREPQKLEPATEEVFLEIMWPNSQSPAPDQGVPDMYFVYDLNVHLYRKPSPAVDVHVHHMLREDTFSNGADVTSLPERFDKAIIALAEVHCNRRSHNYEDMSAAMAVFDQFLLDELGIEGMQMAERTDRIEPWRG
jgi:hypothetical protein